MPTEFQTNRKSSGLGATTEKKIDQILEAVTNKRRSVTSAQRALAVQLLLSHSGTQVDHLYYMAGNAESQAYCKDVAQILVAAGWKFGEPDEVCSGLVGRDFFGMDVAVGYKQELPGSFHALTKALQAIETTFETHRYPQPDQQWERETKYYFVLTIGHLPEQRP